MAHSYSMSLGGTVRPLLAAAVVAHGTTDFDAPAWPIVYSLAALAPAPPSALTAIFCAASCVHFADDTSALGSVLLHTAVAAVGARWGITTAFDVMLGYLGCVHMPLHYRRCWQRGRGRALIIAAACTAAIGGTMCIRPAPSHLMLNHAAQRVVLAHVACEATHPRRIALGGSSIGEWLNRRVIQSKIEWHGSALGRPGDGRATTDGCAEHITRGFPSLLSYRRAVAGPRPPLVRFRPW